MNQNAKADFHKIPSDYAQYEGVLSDEDDVIDIRLISRRDTQNLAKWDRVGNRRPFLPLGKSGAWDDAMLLPPPTPTPPSRKGRFQ